MRKHKKIILLACYLAFCSSALYAEQTSQGISGGGCISAAEHMQSKNQFTHGIRNKVKFLEEHEKLSSIDSILMDTEIPSVSVALIEGGEIAWAEAFKNQAIMKDMDLDCTSLYQAASIAKPVTFMAAYRMSLKGDIDFDRNIEEYLKSYHLPKGKQSTENPVTFRNLFDHTSGITPGGYLGYSRTLRQPTTVDILSGAEGVNSKPIAVTTTPGEQLAYSGGGYTLAELALEDIYGEDFASLMDKWVLEPVGMKQSDYSQPLDSSKHRRVAKGYTYTGEIIEGGWNNHPERAAAGLWSTPSDMARFMIEIYKAYHGKSALFSQADIQSLIQQKRDRHIFGFIVSENGSDIAITHFGGNVGYRAGMTISLVTGNGFAYLVNSDKGGDIGNKLMLTASALNGWDHFKQTLVQRRTVDESVLLKLTGEYRWNDQVDLSIKFKEDSSQLALYFPNGDEYLLSPIMADKLSFIHVNTGVKVVFQSNIEPIFELYGEIAIRTNF